MWQTGRVWPWQILTLIASEVVLGGGGEVVDDEVVFAGEVIFFRLLN
jgi:hypothetical protein